MKKPSERTIKKRLNELRQLIVASKCPIEQRIAYAMESAIIWATEPTVGWAPPAEEALQYAHYLRNDLRLK